MTALRTLPERQRLALVLHHLLDLPVAEVARELGYPTARSSLGCPGGGPRSPPRPGLRVVDWTPAGDDLDIFWWDPARPDAPLLTVRYRWDGTELVPVGG